MPAWVRRAIVLLLLGAAALYVSFWLVARLRSLLAMLLVSLFLAFAMEPAANALARRGWRRGLATAAVFAVLVAAVVVFVTALGSLFLDQVANLVDAPTSPAVPWPNGCARARRFAASSAAWRRPRWACPPTWSGW
jgi:predicted PurR-regulated permease PerM